MDQPQRNQGNGVANLASSAIFRLTMENEALRAQLAQAKQAIESLRKGLTKKQPEDGKEEA